MTKAPKATTFSSRSNAKRAAEKAIATGSAPSIDYGIRERPSGRFEILWHLKGDGSSTSAGETQIATEAVEADTPLSNPFARVEAAEAAEDPLGYRDRLLAADSERRQTMAEPADASEAEVVAPQPEAAEPEADPFAKGAQVLVRIRKKRQTLGMVDYRVDARHVRVFLDVAAKGSPSSLFEVDKLVLTGARGLPPAAPKEERKPRGTPSGARKPSKSAELDAAAARGETPTKPVMTSKANPHYQKRFDKLEAMAMAGDWDGMRGYEVKGINSYAKMVAAYRDRLLAAHEAQQRATEAA
jgi:hypothetical protein